MERKCVILKVNYFILENDLVLVYYHITCDKSLKCVANKIAGSSNQSVIMYNKYHGSPNQTVNVCNTY